MASLTMTPLDAHRPNKRFRSGTTGDAPAPRHIYTNERTRARSSRSASASSYTHSSRRSSAATAPGSNSLSHSAYSLSRSQTSSFSSSPFIATSVVSSRSRSAAEARALVLDPAYSGVGQTQARVYVDESGVAHDPDYRMFPAAPSSPRSCTARRGSMTSARGRCGTSVGGCSESPFTGSPFAGYADFEMHYSNSAGHEVDTDEEEPICMDVDEDAESVIEWSRLHASPPGYGGEKQEEQKKTEDGYADFAGMEWDEKEWMREEVVPVPALDKHQSSSTSTSPASSKDKQSPASFAPIQTAAFSGSNASLPKSYTKAAIRSKPKSSSKAGSVSSTARGYVPAKRSYDESIQDEWAPSCGYSVRRHWQSFTLRIRFTVFRWRRRLRRAFKSAGSGTVTEQRA